MSRKINLLSIVLGLAALPAMAGEATSDAPTVPADPTQAIAEKLPGIDPSSIKATPIAGIFEISAGANIAYVTRDARYLLRGDLIDLDTDANLTEQRRSEARVDQLAALGEDNMIIFGPAAKDAKYEITVFTDLDCGYCRKLHSEIAQLNSLGIRVRYLFFPRSGPNSVSWQKAEQVWCAPDRKSAFTAAKAGQPVRSGECGPTPVTAEWEMGQAFGVTGTPAIVTEQGTLIAGYLPPRELVARLDSEKRLNTAATEGKSSLQ
jgi:thiol:disulfide interchange protein DsbC